MKTNGMKKLVSGFLTLAASVILMGQAAQASTYKVRVFVDNAALCKSDIGACLTDDESILMVRDTNGKIVKKIEVYNRFLRNKSYGQIYGHGRMDEEFLLEGPAAMQLSIDILEDDVFQDDMRHIGTISILPSELKKVHVENFNERQVYSRNYAVVRSENATLNIVEGGRYLQINTVAQSEVYETKTRVTTRPAIRLEIQRIN